MRLLRAGRAYRLKDHSPGHGIYAGRRHWLVIDGDELVTRTGLRAASTRPVSPVVPDSYVHAYDLLAQLEGLGRTWKQEVAAARAEAMELVGDDAAAALAAALESVGSEPATEPLDMVLSVAEPTPAPRSRVLPFDA